MATNLASSSSNSSQSDSVVRSLWVELQGTKPTSPDFGRILHSILFHKKYSKFIEGLADGESVAFINMLDKALGSLPPSTELWDKCLRALRKLCASTKQIPSSLYLSDGLTKTGDVAKQSGVFSDVWTGSYNQLPVAIKSYRVYNSDDLQILLKAFSKEVVIWKWLEHPSILPFLGVSTTLFKLCFVFPWMPFGNVTNYLKSHPGASRVKLVYQVAQGLEFLHSRNIVHGGMKGQNILIDESEHVRMCDFGLASITGDPLSINASTGGARQTSSRWMSPELLDPSHDSTTDRPTQACDVYSFAMCALEIFTGEIPFREYRNQKIVFMVIENRRPKRPANSQAIDLSDEIWNMMQTCWDREPSNRPKIGDVVKLLAKAQGITDPSEVPSSGRLTPLPTDGNKALFGLAGDVPEFPKAKAKTAPSRNQNLSPIYPPQATTSVSTLSKNSSDAGSPSPRPSPATNATIPKLTNVVPPRGAGGKTKPRDTAKVSGARNKIGVEAAPPYDDNHGSRCCIIQ